jgi:hypothetical protein
MKQTLVNRSLKNRFEGFKNVIRFQGTETGTRSLRKGFSRSYNIIYRKRIRRREGLRNGNISSNRMF